MAQRWHLLPAMILTGALVLTGCSGKDPAPKTAPVQVDISTTAPAAPEPEPDDASTTAATDGADASPGAVPDASDWWVDAHDIPYLDLTAEDVSAILNSGETYLQSSQWANTKGAQGYLFGNVEASRYSTGALSAEHASNAEIARGEPYGGFSAHEWDSGLDIEAVIDPAQFVIDPRNPIPGVGVHDATHAVAVFTWTVTMSYSSPQELSTVIERNAQRLQLVKVDGNPDRQWFVESVLNDQADAWFEAGGHQDPMEAQLSGLTDER